MTPEDFASRLLTWFEAHGRRDLPWQRQRTPYRVWVSEVMLQQTQVETVKPYYARFIARFPNVSALAAAPLDDVLGLWSGLGYYARARNLHRAAREIVARHGGRLPESLEQWMALPGIGRSTAGAILSLARGQRQPILDGNARRVLARAFMVEEPSWDLALACTPDSRAAEYTQAIMDLGATVCTRANPACDRCPFDSGCAARAGGRVEELPARKSRRPRRRERTHMLFVLRGGCVLLERRPPRGIWGGLWAPPEFRDAASAQAWAAVRFGMDAADWRRLPVIRHVFSHFDLDIEPWVLEARATAGVADDERRWHAVAQIDDIGLPAPVAKLLKEGLHGTNSALRAARPRSGRARPSAVSG